MGTPAKAKASIRGTSKTRYTKDKTQSVDAESKNLSKKENEIKILPQKLNGKVRETRQSPNRNVGLIRKLNNINDVLTKGTTKKSIPKESKFDLKLKEKIGNSSKNLDKATSRSTESKYSWHDILLRGKNGKYISHLDDEDLLSENIEFESAVLSSTVPKIKKSVSTIIGCQSANSRVSDISKNKSTRNLTEEFEDIFQNLKENASLEEKDFLEERRKELQKIYFGIASSVLEAKLPKNCLSQTIHENLKTEVKEIVNRTYELDEEVFNKADKKKDVSILPEYENLKAVDSLQNIRLKSGKFSWPNENVKRDVEVKELSSISLMENESVHLQFHIKGETQNQKNSQVKADFSAKESSQIQQQEEEVSEDNSIVELNCEIEGFQSSEEYCESDEALIEDGESECDPMSIISVNIDKKTKIKSNDLNVGGMTEYKYKVDLSDFHSNKYEADRFEIDSKNSDILQSITKSEDQEQVLESFDTKNTNLLDSLNSAIIHEQEQCLEEYDSKNIDVQDSTISSLNSTLSYEQEQCVEVYDSKNTDIRDLTISSKNSTISLAQEKDFQKVDSKKSDILDSTLSTQNSIINHDQEKSLKKFESKDELQESIKNAHYEIICGFSEILFSAMQAKPIYNKHEITQSQQSSLNEWTVLHEGGCQQNINNLEPEKNFIEKEVQNDVVSDKEEIDSKLLSDKISNNNIATETKENDHSTKSITNETAIKSNRELVDTILKELQATELSFSKSDYNNDLFLPTSMTQASEMNNLSSLFKISNENSTEIDISPLENEASITKDIKNYTNQNEMLSTKSSELIQSSSQQEILTSTLEDTNKQTQISAQNWIKEFLYRESNSYEPHSSEQQSTEKLELEKCKLSHSHTSEDDYAVVKKCDCKAENAIEVFDKESDTQMLLSQLEYNIEQIRLGLTELSRACDKEFEKISRRRPRLLPLGIKKKLSLTKNAEIELPVNEKPLEYGVHDCCHCNRNSSNGYDKPAEKIENKIESSEMSLRKSVTWGKVEKFYDRSPEMSNTIVIPSANQSNAIVCNQTKQETNEISPPSLIKTSKKEVYFMDEKPLQYSTDIEQSVDVKNIDSFNLSKSIEANKNEEDMNEENFYSELKKFLEMPTCSKKFTKVQRSSMNAEMPTYTGCPCMLDTYKSIIQQTQDTTQNF